MALFFSAFLGMQLVFTLFLQFGHGFSAGQAGLAGLPLAIGAFVGSGLAGGFLLERIGGLVLQAGAALQISATRSDEHPSELQSIISHSYAVFCLTKK